MLWSEHSFTVAWITVTESLPTSTMEKFGQLQSVLKAAARPIFKFPGRTSVSELIRSRLHWLNYPDKVTYKLCVLSYKCLHGAALVYLSRRLVRTSVIPGRAKLRSASSGLLIVPYVPSKIIGSNKFPNSRLVPATRTRMARS